MKNKQQCPNCSSFKTESGHDLLLPDIIVGIIVSVVTVGAGLLFFVPFIGIKGMRGKYNEHIYHCHNCNYNWTA